MFNFKANDIDSLQSILSLTLSRLKRPKLRAKLAPIERRNILITALGEESISLPEPEDD